MRRNTGCVSICRQEDSVGYVLAVAAQRNSKLHMQWWCSISKGLGDTSALLISFLTRFFFQCKWFQNSTYAIKFSYKRNIINNIHIRKHNIPEKVSAKEKEDWEARVSATQRQSGPRNRNSKDVKLISCCSRASGGVWLTACMLTSLSLDERVLLGFVIHRSAAFSLMNSI